MKNKLKTIWRTIFGTKENGKIPIITKHEETTEIIKHLTELYQVTGDLNLVNRLFDKLIFGRD